MASEIIDASRPILSICIATFNRAALLRQTLDSVLSQVTRECEVIVSDNASTDGTEHVVLDYKSRFRCIRYFKQEKNLGLDRNFDSAVRRARGEYCWCFSDDDLMKPGAIKAILKVLSDRVSLVIVNAEIRNHDMSKLYTDRWVDLSADRIYNSEEMDRLLCDICAIVAFIGSFVIHRDIWLSRKVDHYYGSLFVHVGAIFQKRLPGMAVFLAEPYVSYRSGNVHSFSPKMFETFVISFPSVVCTLDLSESTKTKIGGSRPWTSLPQLLFRRGMGHYSLNEYRRLVRPRLHSFREAIAPLIVAILPGLFVNTILILHVSLLRSWFKRRRFLGAWNGERLINYLKESPFYLGNWRATKS